MKYETLKEVTPVVLENVKIRVFALLLIFEVLFLSMGRW